MGRPAKTSQPIRREFRAEKLLLPVLRKIEAKLRQWLSGQHIRQDLVGERGLAGRKY
jgi:hypothetical protein